VQAKFKLGRIVMPNGGSKNWIRFLLTLESFYILHGKWPTVIHLYPFFISELQAKLTKEDFQKLLSKIKLEPDTDNPFLSFDELGNRFDYGREEFLEGNTVLRAIDWLDINEPNYYD